MLKLQGTHPCWVAKQHACEHSAHGLLDWAQGSCPSELARGRNGTSGSHPGVGSIRSESRPGWQIVAFGRQSCAGSVAARDAVLQDRSIKHVARIAAYVMLKGSAASRAGYLDRGKTRKGASKTLDDPQIRD